MYDAQLYFASCCGVIPMFAHWDPDSPFGLCFHEKYKNYLQAKPVRSQCQALEKGESLFKSSCKEK